MLRSDIRLRDIVHLRKQRISDVDLSFDCKAKFVVVDSDGPLLRCRNLETCHEICDFPSRFEVVSRTNG